MSVPPKITPKGAWISGVKVRHKTESALTYAEQTVSIIDVQKNKEESKQIV